MYTHHWGLRESPFRGSLDPRYYFNSPSHDEALARLHFLVDHQRRLGVMRGASGSGKSLLLEVFVRQLRKAAKHAVVLGLLGVDNHEFLWQLASRLGDDPDPREPISRHWRTLSDRFRVNRYQQIDTVLLLDDADEADPELLTSITRLVQWEPEPESRLTIVLTTKDDRTGRLGRRVLELCELRIDLLPWQYEDTAGYLQSALDKAGRHNTTFDPQAVARLHELTSGVPRRVRQVAELALLAGAGQELEHIDQDTVDQVSQELMVGAGGAG